MGAAMELISGHVVAPGATFTALTMHAGSSLTVRNARLDSKVRLLQAWADHQVAGNVRIRSPKLHDNVQGIRLFSVASEVVPLLSDLTRQPLYPQDTLIVEVTGSGVAGDVESVGALIYYEDLPGAEARFTTTMVLKERGVNYLAVENTIATGVAGGFSGEEAINAEFDLFKANTDYALVGYRVSAECASVRWRGADTGNLGVGGPGNELGGQWTREWFIMLQRQHDVPLIPVFNSANKAGILIDAVQDENGADVTVTSLFVELAPGWQSLNAAR